MGKDESYLGYPLQEFVYEAELMEKPSKSTFLVFAASRDIVHGIANINVVVVKEGQVYDACFEWFDYSSTINLKVSWDRVLSFFDTVEYVTAFGLGAHKAMMADGLSSIDRVLPDKKYFCAYNYAKNFLSEKVARPVFEDVCIALDIPIKERAVAVAEMIPKIESLSGVSIVDYVEGLPASSKDYLKNYFTNQQSEADYTGLTFIDTNAIAANFFNGKSVVVTGNFVNFPDRKVLIELLERKGAVVRTSVSSKTNIVLIGEGAGPSKIKKIKDLIDKGNYIQLINDDSIFK